MIIYESFFVGYYVIFIYVILWLLLFLHMDIHIIIQLFIIGFFKHFISYYIGIHNYYCNHNHKKRNITIFIESIFEGFLFIITGMLFIFVFKIKNFILCLFIIGFFLHLINEINMVHSYFCSHTFF